MFNYFQGGLKVLPIERDRGNNMIQAYWLSVFSVGRPLNFVPFFFFFFERRTMGKGSLWD